MRVIIQKQSQMLRSNVLLPLSRPINTFQKLIDVTVWRGKFKPGITETYNLYCWYQAKFYSMPAQHPIRIHRKYYKQKRRGFGEDAFHYFWYEYFAANKPTNILEIGVYRGQSITLFALLAKLNHYSCQVVGISPLTSAGDEFSKYIDLDYEKDILLNAACFEVVDSIKLVKSLSMEDSAQKMIASKTWDLVYIDGSHKYEDVMRDLVSSLKYLNPGGILVVSDCYMGKCNGLPPYAFKGHSDVIKATKAFIADNPILQIFNIGHLCIINKA